MPVNDFRLAVLIAAVLAGAGALPLGLVLLDLACTLGHRLWLLASPRAARQARIRAAVAAYPGPSRQRARRSA